MRSNEQFMIMVLFSILSIVATTIYSSVIISQNRKLISKLRQKTSFI